MANTEQRDIDQRLDELLGTSREIKAVVLDLQRSLKAPEEVAFVRSCTSCLQDSCNKPKLAAEG